ncbi:hypothetical protein [Flavobacterium sp. MK4S-17]|uniref:hypothetical protein n=1 Tax=Flavobacterium sp. MK4S-17 TaxID=2543737 RepID=UPI00135682A0|nr:hypothetical protein [Flavobacterium sp. MK4S-17]
MKLTEKQISKIQEYVNRDGIFYADICHEMTDHIAATLEERLEKDDVGFEEALKEYMNSHQKVKLLTAVKEQQKIKDGFYRSYFLKQFITVRGILAFLSVFTIFYLLSNISYVIVDVFTIALYLLLYWASLGRHLIKIKVSPSLIHFYKETMLYFLFPVLFMQLRRFFKEEEWFLWANLFIIALCYTGVYAVYLTNQQYLKKNYA